MNPRGDGRRSYWCAGGDIEGRAGAVAPERARSLFAFHLDHSLSAVRRGAPDTASFFARVAIELAEALGERAAWAAARNALRGDCEARVWRENSRTWLTNGARVKKLLNYLDSLGPR